MKAPTVAKAYAMIRLLQKRAQTGDAEKIAELRALIEEERTKQATLDLETFFPTKKAK